MQVIYGRRLRDKKVVSVFVRFRAVSTAVRSVWF
jgi:hypothetical protein